MRHLWMLTCVVFLFFSCRHNSGKSDESIFPKDSIIEATLLVDYMVEIFLIEAAIYKVQHDGKSIHRYASEYYENFFSSHSVSKKKLKKSIEYYVSQKQMEELLQNVVTKLTEIDLKNTSSEADSTNTLQKTAPWLDSLLITN